MKWIVFYCFWQRWKGMEHIKHSSCFKQRSLLSGGSIVNTREIYVECNESTNAAASAEHKRQEFTIVPERVKNVENKGGKMPNFKIEVQNIRNNLS
jgi:hypothetical protein